MLVLIFSWVAAHCWVCLCLKSTFLILSLTQRRSTMLPLWARTSERDGRRTAGLPISLLFANRHAPSQKMCLWRPRSRPSTRIYTSLESWNFYIQLNFVSHLEGGRGGRNSSVCPTRTSRASRRTRSTPWRWNLRSLFKPTRMWPRSGKKGPSHMWLVVKSQSAGFRSQYCHVMNIMGGESSLKHSGSIPACAG